MSITVEAVFEAGVLKPLTPLAGLHESDRVVVTVELVQNVQRCEGRIEIDPTIAQEIIESADFSIMEA